MKNNKGQHIIEYTTLLILVMAGILIMSPYVRRSWFANLKSWEDSYVDSIEDPLMEVDDRDIVGQLPGCSCSIQAPCEQAVCCGFAGCAETEASLLKVCNILGCEPEDVTCTSDSRCCSTPRSTHLCGAAGGCPDRHELLLFECGSEPKDSRSVCQITANCGNICLGGLPPSYKGTLCPGDDIGLDSDTNYVTVTDCSCPLGSPPECEIRCTPPFIPTAGVLCECPPGTVESPVRGCPPGMREQGPCNEGEYLASGCGDGYCALDEDCGLCAPDCGPCTCGDGYCSSSENCALCAEDCGGDCFCAELGPPPPP